MYALIFAAAILSFAQVREAGAQIDAHYTESMIRLDGVLNEDAWASARPITGFTQMELEEGEPATEKTEVKVLYGNDNLYIGVICHDSDPAGIIHRQLNWDGSFSSDDYFAVVLDTYQDRRMGFYFAVNPNGAQRDATFRSGSTTNPQTDLNTEWDAIWETAVRITDRGWTIEIEIPFKSLRFPTSDEQSWGVNFLRSIRRKNEISLWKSWRRNQGLQLLTQAGTLTMSEHLERSRQIDVKPYVLGGVEKVAGEDIDDITKAGVELKYGITSNTTLDLTVNTDFAQIESDREVINLTRFDIHYPEKRDFFLEGSDTFDFTQGGTRLFYSRRIGITPDRYDQPILAGAKLTQKAGGYRLGMLTMQTDSERGYPGANYSVARVKKDIFEQSYIGFIATSTFDENNHDNQVYGVDWILRTDKFLGDKNLDIQGYLSGSVTDGRMHESSAGRLYISYPNDLVNSFILYHALDERFNPELGFARVVGIKNYIWFTTLSPRPDIPYIKKLELKPFNFNYTTDMDGRLLFRDVEIRPIGIITDSDDRFTFSVRNDYDYVYETDFSIYGNLVPSQVYDNWYYDTRLSSSGRRPVSASISGRWGDFYNGSSDKGDVAVTYKASSHYALTADASYNKITIGGNEIIARDYGGRVSIDFSTRLSTSTFIQYNNETRRVNTNFRLHYIPKIGSDLYLVYNEEWDTQGGLNTRNRTLLAKFTYLLSF